MKLLKRSALSASIVCVMSLPAAAVAVASGGWLAPGQYVFNSTSAQASFSGPAGPNGAPGFSIFVNRGLNSFQPEDGNGSPVVTKSTMLDLFEFSPTGGGGGGCFIINPADFTVSRDVQTASLHTTLTAAEACPGFGAPVKGSGVAAPLKGGGGGGLVYPIKVDVTWNGHGVTGTDRDTNTFTCADYSSQSTNVSRTAGATASGTASGVDGFLTTSFATVYSTDSHLEINGAPLLACFGK